MRDTVGIDPSLTATGIAHAGGTLTVSGCKGDDRLVSIRDAVADIAEGAELAVVEGIMEGGTGSARTGMAHGVVRLALLDLAVDFVLVAPATLKTYACGKGNATKPDMRMSLFRRFGLDLRADDEVDAFWLRALGLDLLGRPLIELPASHRRALEKVARPEVAA